MTRYLVTAQREGRLWALEVPEVPGALSMVRRLEQAEAHIREAIAFVLGVPEDSFEVVVEPIVPADWSELIEQARALRASADSAAAASAALTREVVADMKAAGLSVRDAGRLLGVSPQRISQLTAP